MPALAGLDLAVILFWVGALIFCYLVAYIAKALLTTTSGAVGWLPGVGGWLKTGLGTVEHKIVSVMSVAAAKCDAHLGAALHDLARLVDWIGREIESHATQLAMLASFLPGVSNIAALRNTLANLWALVRQAESALVGIGHDIIPRVKHAEKGIGHDIPQRIRSLDREIGRVVEHDIASLRARERALENGALKTFRWIKAHPDALASTAFAGAVAWALARLGGGWIRCKNWNRIGRHVCGLPASLIEDIIGLTFGLLVVLDPGALAEEAVALVDVVEPVLARMLPD